MFTITCNNFTYNKITNTKPSMLCHKQLINLQTGIAREFFTACVCPCNL